MLRSALLFCNVLQLHNDILISVVGTLGNACIVQKEEIPAIFSCKSTVIKAKRVDPFYLLSYLNSKYGKTLLLRKERGAIRSEERRVGKECRL